MCRLRRMAHNALLGRRLLGLPMLAEKRLASHYYGRVLLCLCSFGFLADPPPSSYHHHCLIMSVEMETCPASAPFFGFMGVTSALVFANIGAAYGTAKSGVGISSMGVMNPGLVMRNIIPVVMAGVLGIYGLIVAVIIQGSILSPQNGLSQYSLYTGFAHLAAGLCCGLSGLAAGMAIGIVGDAGVRAVGQQEKLFVGMILILIFAEALGLYGTSTRVSRGWCC